ncbi:aldehyde dehydrogenase (NAD(P)(+)) ald5 [Knufia peltigerae]|uniref:Aldehyde dehydrogenase n=1 Tax=Knufia peltigerae TaxID=1002370 RepID=A0AA38XQX0_9EURO|nr:aldehyde dehydrogenase (NAD(P)(+)) ald5 [Knufia peltigerae]
MSLSVVIKTPTVSYEQPLGLYIDGKWAAGVEQKTFETINPANECIIASVYIDIAVKAARKALNGIWAQTAPSQRGRLLTKLADLFEEDLETLSAIESLDNGKAISLSRGDVQAAADVLRYYGGWADKLHGKVIDTDPETLNYTRHEPIGVCGQIIPWNFPLLMWSWKIGPALATGNTVVLKTAEQTPLSGLYAANLCHKAGIPAGVVNIVSGVGGVAGAALAAHMDVDKIAFTGSTLIGRKIMRAAADSNLKKVTLELGGKSPNIVFNDATIDLAISWVNFGIFFNQGQCCCAGSRIYVQSGVYDQFVEAFKARVGRNIVGDPFADNTFQGPQVSRLQYDRIMGYIRSGNEEGATLEIGGQRQGTEGFYIQPTVFSNVKPEMTIMREEIFGPVCVICKFETEEEVVRLSNDSVYGLAAAVHTRDLNTAIRVSNALSAGTVWVNNYNMLTAQVPFGGCKESGIGRELGKYALSNYTHVKSVRIRVGGALF